VKEVKMFKSLKLSGTVFIAVMLTFALSFSVLQATCDVCDDSEDVVLEIRGMTCAGCEGKVEKVLSACEGVSDVNVNYKDGKAELYLEDGKASIDDLIEALEHVGFKASN
jgi:copper chaperone CopZ